MPPDGSWSTRERDAPLMLTVPNSSSRAARIAIASDSVKMPALKPQGLSFAAAMASPISSYALTVTTGPNTSSQTRRMSARTPDTTVASMAAPTRPPPHTSAAPCATASSIQRSTRIAAASLISGARSVVGSIGSPSRRRLAWSASAAVKASRMER